jgi:hypothetical protein
MATPSEVDHDDLKLREAGFDPLAPPESALETLHSLRTEPGVSEAAIARALGEVRIVGAADELTAMEAHASGSARREIRRALFRLRQRGIEPSRTLKAEPSPSPRPAAPPEQGLSAVLCNFDSEGMRFVWLLKPRLQGGLNQLTAVTSETEGLVGVGITTRSRRELREKRAEIERDFDLKLIDADWRLADFILCEAYRHTVPSRRSEVGDFFALRAEIIAAPPPADFVHPVYAELLTEPIEASAELVKDPEILAWHLAEDEIKPYLDEIHEIENSPLLLNQLQQKDRIDAVLDQASVELFGGRHSERRRRRLEDVAYYLARSGRMEPARWAAAAAAAIRDRADLKRIPFFGAFIRLALSAELYQEEKRAEEEPRLVVTPAEAMREARERQR